MPEFVAPEIVRGEGVSFPADLWSVGVITHLLLTGISIFRGDDDRATLNNIKEFNVRLTSVVSFLIVVGWLLSEKCELYFSP